MLDSLKAHVQTGLFLNRARIFRLCLYGTIFDTVSTYIFIYEYGMTAWRQVEGDKIAVYFSKTNVGIYSVAATSPIEFFGFLISTELLYLVFTHYVLPFDTRWQLKFIGEAGIWMIILFLLVYVPAGNINADLMKYWTH